MDNRTPEQWITETLDENTGMRLNCAFITNESMFSNFCWDEYLRECDAWIKDPQYDKDVFFASAEKCWNDGILK